MTLQHLLNVLVQIGNKVGNIYIYIYIYDYQDKMSSISGCTLAEDLPGTNIFVEKKRLGFALAGRMYWLLGLRSELSTGNKFLICRTELGPIWAYGKQIRGAASTSNMEILECFRSKALGMEVTDLFAKKGRRI
jgi:hypothetical protein